MLKLLLAMIMGLSPLLGAYICILTTPKDLYPGWGKFVYLGAGICGVYLFFKYLFFE